MATTASSPPPAPASGGEAVPTPIPEDRGMVLVVPTPLSRQGEGLREGFELIPLLHHGHQQAIVPITVRQNDGLQAGITGCQKRGR